jgi:hypothetical protein
MEEDEESIEIKSERLVALIRESGCYFQIINGQKCLSVTAGILEGKQISASYS